MDSAEKGIIGIIGAGTMGSGIAQVASAAVHPVKVYDNNEGALTKAEAALESTVSKLTEKGKMTATAGKALLSNIEWVSDLQKFKGCTLVIEAIAENTEAKQNIFSAL